MSSLKYITLTPEITASIRVPGYMMYRTSNIYLSSDTVVLPGSATPINDYFTINPLVSSFMPAITGYNYANFTTEGQNYVIVNLFGLSGSGYIDVIFYNKAGYTKLSDKGYLVALSITTLPVTGSLITTENGNYIITETGDMLTSE
jgi:hypothetical protein